MACSNESTPGYPSGTALANATAGLLCGYDYESFEIDNPSDEVRYYHQHDFVPPNDKDWEAYTWKAFVFPGLIIFIVAWIVSTWLLVWSCKMCKGKDPPVCCTSKLTRIVLLLFMVVVCVVGFAMVVVAIVNGNDQRDALENLVEAADMFVGMFATIQSQAKDGLNDYTPVESSAIALVAAVAGSSLGATEQAIPVAIAANLVLSKGTNFAEINSTAAKLSRDFEEARDYIENYREMADGDVNTVIVTGMALVIVLSILHVMFALCKCLKPHTCSKGCCGILFTLIASVYFLLIVAFFVVAICLGLWVAVLSDFCYGADTNALKIVDDDYYHYAYYRFYVKCDEDAAIAGTIADTWGTLTDPVFAPLIQATGQCDSLLTAISSSSMSGSDKAALTDQTSALKTQISALNVSLGSSSTPNGFEAGRFSSMNCLHGNVRYQAMLNQACDSLYNPFLLSMEYLVSVAALMTLLDAARRWARPTSAELGSPPPSKVKPVEGGQKPQSGNKPA